MDSNKKSSMGTSRIKLIGTCLVFLIGVQCAWAAVPVPQLTTLSIGDHSFTANWSFDGIEANYCEEYPEFELLYTKRGNPWRDASQVSPGNPNDAGSGAYEITDMSRRSFTVGQSSIGRRGTGQEPVTLDNDSIYDVLIRVFTYDPDTRSCEWSDDSAIFSVTPTLQVPHAPDGLTATPGAQRILLTWVLPTNTSQINNVQVRYKLRTASAWGGWANLPPSSTSQLVTGLTDHSEYRFEVRAVNSAGDGAAATIDAIPSTVLADAPTRLEATPTDAQVTLNWVRPTNTLDIDNMQVRHKVKSATNWGAWVDLAATATQYTSTGLTSDVEYSFEVRASNSAGGGGVATIDSTPFIVVPAPVVTALTGGDRSLTVSWRWDPPSIVDCTVPWPLFEVRYRKSGEPWRFGNEVTASNPNNANSGVLFFSIEQRSSRIADGITVNRASPPGMFGVALENDSQYDVVLKTLSYHSLFGGSCHWSVDSEILSATTRLAVAQAPESLAATAGDTQVVLNWVVPMNTSEIDNMQVRYTEKSANNWGTWADLSGSATTHTVDGLTNGTEYTFAVRAVNGAGDGAVATVDATPVQAVLAAPTNLGAMPGDTRIRLNWTLPADAGAIDNMQVRHRQKSVTGWSDWTSLSESATSHTVDGLTNGTAYTFAVRAVNQTGDGAAATVDAIPTLAKPASPANLAATAGDTQVELGWELPVNTSQIGTMQVRHKLKTAQVWNAWSDLSATATSTIVTGLTNDSEYSFEVRASNDAGDGEVATVDATPVLATPDVPTNLMATAGNAQVVLGWTLPANTSEIDRVQVRHKVKAAERWGAWSDLPSTATTTTVTGLVNETEHTFAVRAVNNAGEGAAETVDATPTEAVLPAPEDLTAVAGDTTVDLSWTLPPDTPGIDIDRMQVRYKVKTGDEWGDWSDLSDTATTTTVTGLANDTEYTFAVRAMSEVGEGAVATADATPKLATPGAPSNLQARAGNTQVTLSWTLPANTSTIDMVQLRYSMKTARRIGRWIDLANTATEYTVTDLTNDIEYRFEVRALNQAGGGSATVNATPIEKDLLISDSMRAILPAVANVIGDQTLSSIRERIQGYQFNSGSGAGLRVAGDWNYSTGEWTPVQVDAEQFLLSNEFPNLVNSFNRSGTGSNFNDVSIWMGAERTSFKDGDSLLPYRGSVANLSFGIDTVFSDDMIGGIRLSRFKIEAEYERDRVSGSQRMYLTSVNPYFGLRLPKVTVWSFFGVGSGRFELIHSNATGRQTSDLLMNSAGVGASGELWRTGTTTANLTGEISLNELKVPQSGLIDELNVHAHRSRLLLELSQRYKMARGGLFEPSFEFGVVHDGGDGADSSSLELGAKVQYRSVSRRVLFSLSSYGLVERDDYREWGVKGAIEMKPLDHGRGLSFRLQPSYGAEVRDVERIWEPEDTRSAVDDDHYRPRLDAGLGYGFRIIRDQALLMPFSEMSLKEDEQTYRIGTRFRYGSAVELNLIGESVDSIDRDTPEHYIRFQGGIRF